MVDETKTVAEKLIVDYPEAILNPAGPAAVSERYVVWVYNTPEYWESGDPFLGLVGNAPIAVDRESGDFIRLPTFQSIEANLNDLEARTASWLPDRP
jgi:hypothetical protein